MRLEHRATGGSNIGYRLAKMVPRISICMALVLILAASAFADVSLTDRKSYAKTLSKKQGNTPPLLGATGSIKLIDNSGLQWSLDTNITFSTTSSASGAMSEASYTHAVSATTSGGGLTNSTLNDAYDGYNTICLSLNNTVANCATGNANFVIYNKNGPASSECLGSVSGVNRQIVFPIQTSGSIQLSRKVFVPDNDSFARWMNIVTNTGGVPQTVTLVVANNLGSDSNTIITTSSSGNAVAEVGDTWVASMQNYSGNKSSDPRLGHVFRGTGTTALAGINFVNGDDNPFWGYTFTLAPGETKIILNFAAGQPTKDAAAAKAASLANLTNPNAMACMSGAEKAAVANFNLAPLPLPIPTMGQWGIVIFIVLSGLGSIYFLRRQRSRG